MHDDDALSETEIEEGGLEAGVLDHRLDRRDRQRRACAESGGGDAGGEAALVGKPFQRVADAGAVHAAGADAGDDHAEIVAVERGRLGVDRPSDGAEDAADQNDDARAVFIDEPAFDRHQPGLEQHEQRKCPLDRGAIPSEFLLDVGDEESPAILVIGDHHHREDADGQLRPAIGVADAGCHRGCRSVHCVRHFSSVGCSIDTDSSRRSLVYVMPVDKKNLARMSQFLALRSNAACARKGPCMSQHGPDQDGKIV